MKSIFSNSVQRHLTDSSAVKIFSDNQYFSYRMDCLAGKEGNFFPCEHKLLVLRAVVVRLASLARQKRN